MIDPGAELRGIKHLFPTAHHELKTEVDYGFV